MPQDTRVRLTQLTQKAGCASKFTPDYLERVLSGFAPADADGFASGMESHDDAGYIAFGSGLLLQSVDFFTPIVDDPYRFGQVAAANALSDIYAMGGEPLTALNLVAFPCELDPEVLREILAGGGSKLEEAGARLLGGHSVQDDVPKYGVAVTGFVETDRIVRNRGARPGDALVLTKPLGLGILVTALKRELVGEEEIEEAVSAATRLNRGARDAMRAVGPSAATDVTGYGLLGHAGEMLLAAGLGAVIRRGAVPVWKGAQELAADGCYAAGLAANREHREGDVVADGVGAEELLPLYDPQTSGGLLIAVAPERVDALVDELAAREEVAAVIGEVTGEAVLRVTP
ncbi:MAG: selenide, water dikinase SelD [Thermoleophilaceae bacterium]|nr:selenide, water dikinase SelD [Thermoleophilaceae bacterium]